MTTVTRWQEYKAEIASLSPGQETAPYRPAKGVEAGCVREQDGAYTLFVRHLTPEGRVAWSGEATYGTALEAGAAAGML